MDPRNAYIEALERAARWNRTEAEIADFDSQAVDSKHAAIAERYAADAKLLRALADALRGGTAERRQVLGEGVKSVLVIELPEIVERESG